MLRVMTFGEGAIHPKQLERDEMQTAALETPDHLADETALHAVGLDQDESPFKAHGAKV